MAIQTISCFLFAFSDIILIFNKFKTLLKTLENGKFWYFPFLQVSAYGEGSGVARADGSKYSVTLLAENETLAYEVDPAIIAGLLV
jgi:hypothetical protein